MIPRQITSLQHPLVKRLVKLRESRAVREEEGTVLVVGKTVVEEVARKRQIKTLISAHPLLIAAEKQELATPDILQKIIGHSTDDLVAAEVVAPATSDLSKAGLVVVLDGLGDPGNVGTIFRTALALGWEGVFILKGTADPYNDKALRASRAAPLLLPWCEGSWDDVKKLQPRQVVVADTQGTPLSKMAFQKPLLLILGHETRGPSPEALKLGTPVTIPMKGPMESLNVASAASILLYHIQEVFK